MPAAFSMTPLRSSCPTSRAALRLRTSPRRVALVARAELNTNNPLQNVTDALDGFLKRYDVLSTGAGALLVTSYCVYAHGQDPFTALSITFTSTVVALVANELLFNNSSNKGQ